MEAKFSISEVAGTSWKFTKSQIWVLAGMFLAYCVVTGILNLITSSSYVLNLLVQLIIGSLFTLGFIRNMFQTMDGEEPQFSAYGQEARKFLHYLVANILYSIIVCIGIVLLIIPGIYLAIRLQFFQQYIVSEERLQRHRRAQKELGTDPRTGHAALPPCFGADRTHVAGADSARGRPFRRHTRSL